MKDIWKAGVVVVVMLICSFGAYLGRTYGNMNGQQSTVTAKEDNLAIQNSQDSGISEKDLAEIQTQLCEFKIKAQDSVKLVTLEVFLNKTIPGVEYANEDSFGNDISEEIDAFLVSNTPNIVCLVSLTEKGLTLQNIEFPENVKFVTMKFSAGSNGKLHTATATKASYDSVTVRFQTSNSNTSNVTIWSMDHSKAHTTEWVFNNDLEESMAYTEIFYVRNTGNQNPQFLHIDLNLFP